MAAKLQRIERMSRKPKQRTGKERGYIARSITLPPEIDTKLHAHAEKEERSLSQIVARALREYFERDEKKSPSK